MADTGKITIKKYSNRRLYDTTNGRYVTLDDISDLIKEGNSVEVLDSKTKEDITKLILAQIILEKERSRKNLLPTSFLYQIIQTNEEFIQDFFEQYLSMTLEAYVNSRQIFEKKLKEMSHLGRLPAEMGELFLRNMGFLGMRPNGAESAPEEGPEAQGDLLRGELDLLKKKLEEMEKEIGERERGKK
jgi:polyhydroxyalkanoate synthesis repressor PhaR